MLLCMTTLNARPVDVARAKEIGQKFAQANFNNYSRSNELQLVYTGASSRGEACFYAFNAGDDGFVIVSADDRFRPIVGYSDEGPFATENMSPELAFYLGKDHRSPHQPQCHHLRRHRAGMAKRGRHGSHALTQRRSRC